MKMKRFIALLTVLTLLTGCGSTNEAGSNQDTSQNAASNEDSAIEASTDDSSSDDSSSDDSSVDISDAADPFFAQLDTSKFDKTKFDGRILFDNFDGDIILTAPFTAKSIIDMGYRLDNVTEQWEEQLNETLDQSPYDWLAESYNQGMWHDNPANPEDPYTADWDMNFPIVEYENPTYQAYLDDDCFMLTTETSLDAAFPINAEDYEAELINPEILYEIFGQPSSVFSYESGLEEISEEEIYNSIAEGNYLLLLAYEYDDYTLTFTVSSFDWLDKPIFGSFDYFSKKGWEIYKERITTVENAGSICVELDI